MKSEESKEPGFAPYDLTDGRKPGDWKSRYSDPEARRNISKEARYLILWLTIGTGFLISLVIGFPQDWLNLSGSVLQKFNLCLGAWIAGTLGGTAFSLKWLYHTVAHNIWNLDRKLWRYFTPLISGVLGLLIVFIVASGLFGFFNPSVVKNFTFVIAFSFITGYFSDNAVAKLTEIATSIFGSTKSTRYYRKNK